MFSRFLRMRPVFFFIVIVVLFSSAQAQAKEMVWQPEGESEPAFSVNFDVITSHIEKETKQFTHAYFIKPANYLASETRKAVQTAASSISRAVRTTEEKVARAGERTLTFLTPDIQPPNLSLSFSSFSRSPIGEALTPWSQSAQVTQAQAEPSPTNSLPPQDVIEESMQANLLAQANTSQTLTPQPLSAREALKQEIISEVLSTLQTSPASYASLSQAEIVQLKNELRSLVSRQSDSDTRARTTVIQNITNTGTLTDPNISGATITSSTFSGTTGTFTSLTSDTVDFDSINGDASTFTDLSFTTATGTSATTTNFFSTTASSTNLATSNFTFGGITGSVWTDFCETITGSSELCDGDDEAGGGGGSSSGSVFVGARGYLTVQQSLSDGTWTSIALAAESHDTDSFHDNSTNNTRLTVPTGKAGKYRVSGVVSFAASSGGTYRGARIYKNGSSALSWNYNPALNATSPVGVPVFADVELAVGDYIELQGLQSTGGSLQANAGAMYTFLEMTYLGGTSPLQVFTGARAYRASTNQSIPDSTYTAISFNAEAFDTDGFHDNSTNPTRLTIPSGKAGKYQITGSLNYAANATGVRYATISKNGTNIHQIEENASTAFRQSVTATVVADLAVGDYIELKALQSSGGAIDVNFGDFWTTLELTYLGGSGTELSTMADGTAAAPGGAFNQDADTGFFRPAANVLGVSTGGTERLRIDSSGNVGIRTTDLESWNAGFSVVQLGPVGAFAADDTAEGVVGLYNNAYTKVGGSTDYYRTTDEATKLELKNGTFNLKVASSGTADAAVTWTTALSISSGGATSLSGALGVNGIAPGTMAGGQTTTFVTNGYSGLGGLRVNGADTSNTIYSTLGNIGLAASAGNITASGTAGTCTINNGGCASDERLKSEITLLEDSLAKLKQINGVSYRWNSSPGEIQYGVIAQNVQEFFPDLVSPIEIGGEEYLQVNYRGLTGPIIEAIKELDLRLTALEPETATSTSTTTTTVTDSSGLLDTLLWAGMQLFERSVKVVEITGERVIATLGVFDKAEIDKLEVGSEFCVDGVCVNKDQLRALLESAGGTASAVTSDSNSESSTEDTSTAEETATTTEEVVEEDTASTTDEVTEEEPVVEEVVTEESSADETASSTSAE